MSAMPPLSPPLQANLRERVCNTKIVVASTTPQQITSFDNNKQGVIIQNQDTTNNAYLTFNSGSTAGAVLRIVPGGSISFDFAVSEPLYVFTTSGTAQCVALEITGYDTFQMLQIKLLENIANSLTTMVNMLARGRK